MKSKLLIILCILIIVFVCIIIFFYEKKKNLNIKDIKSLYFSYTEGYSYEANYVYDLKCSDDCKITIKNKGETIDDAKTYILVQSKMSEIENILNKYHVGIWDGFSKSNKHVLDGNSFEFYLKMKNGKGVSASGYMKWPKDYDRVKKELISVFNDFS